MLLTMLDDLMVRDIWDHMSEIKYTQVIPLGKRKVYEIGLSTRELVHLEPPFSLHPRQVHLLPSSSMSHSIKVLPSSTHHLGNIGPCRNARIKSG